MSSSVCSYTNQAKALVESAPCIIKKDVSKEDADAMVEKLKELGGNVVLE